MYYLPLYVFDIEVCCYILRNLHLDISGYLAEWAQLEYTNYSALPIADIWQPI